MDNARLLLQIDNTKLAQDDFKNKYFSIYLKRSSARWQTLSRSCFSCRLDDEIKARKVLEKDVDNLKKTYEDTELKCKQTQKEMDLVREELQRLNRDHKNVSASHAGRGD